MDFSHELIMAIMNEGYSDTVMDAARSAGAGGGTVLSDPYFGAFDKDMQLSYAVPGYGFAEIFGAREDDIREGDAREIVYRSETHRVTGLLMNETFRDVAADALATYADGTPAILSHKWGRGRAILSGVSLGNSCAEGALISDDILADGQNRLLRRDKSPFDLLHRSCFLSLFQQSSLNAPGSPRSMSASGLAQ